MGGLVARGRAGASGWVRGLPVQVGVQGDVGPATGYTHVCGAVAAPWPGGRAVTADELIAEGERLARPCLILSEARPGEPVVGLWGIRDDTDREGPLLSIRVDCAWLRRRGFDLDGYPSVYADAERCDFTVVHTPHGRLPAHEGTAIPLSGREGRSLPQEAILALGEATTGRLLPA